MVGAEVETTTAAIDIAGDGVEPCIFVTVDAVTHCATLDIDQGAVENVTVLAAAEDRAAHVGGATDVDACGVDVGEVGIVDVTGVAWVADMAGFTEAAAEDVTLDVIGGGGHTAGTHGAAGDGHPGVAAVGHRGGDGVVGVAGEDSHRGHFAATIDVTLHPGVALRGLRHGYLGVGSDETGREVGVGTLAAAEDIAVDGAAEDVDQRRGRGGGVGGVLGQVGTAIDVDDLIVAGIVCTVDVDGDGTRDVTVDVGTTEGVVDLAAEDGEVGVAVDVGFDGVLHASACAGGDDGALGAAVDLAELATLDGEGDVAGDVGLVGACIGGLELHAAAQGGGELDVVEVGHI